MLSLLTAILGVWGVPSSVPLGSPIQAVHVQAAQADVSDRVQPYTKWGKLALDLAQKRYSNYAITDYLHVGRTTYTSTYAKETFKFWVVKPDGHEFGVYVKVYFDPQTDHVTQVLFCETDH